MLHDDLLHLIGEAGVILPTWLKADEPATVRLEWRGFREAGWTVLFVRQR